MLRLPEPSRQRALSTKEQILLLESSRLNGLLFPPWPPRRDAGAVPEVAGNVEYQDETAFALSVVQDDHFDGWRSGRTIIQEHTTNQTYTDTNSCHVSTGRHDLVQDLTTDCSIVASLCAITTRKECGHGDLVLSIFDIPNDRRDLPTRSENGKIFVKLYFNGCYRYVTIDDRLPVSKSDRCLYVIDRNDRTAIWPALVEKAYLKMRGGYDFPGSDSGIDLWALTGWIPERLHLQDTNLDTHALWRRLFNAFNYGDVLVTIGTGDLTRIEEIETGLIGLHNYAVIGIEEVDGERLFHVKNPWISESHVRQSCPRPQARLKGLETKSSTADLSTKSSEVSDNTFWISSEQILLDFEFIFMNWNPCLFSHREDIHFKWDLQNDDSAHGFLRHNPQYSLTSQRDGVVWLLLSRHYEGRQVPSAQGAIADKAEGFISLYAFDKQDGNRVLSGAEALITSPYTNSSATLLKLEVSSTAFYTIVISQQALKKKTYTFSLSGLSRSPIQILAAKERLPFELIIASKWVQTTSGGNACNPHFRRNPQYSLEVHKMTEIALVLESVNPDLMINIKLLWSSAGVLGDLRNQDVLADSGEYTKSFAVAQRNSVMPGQYTVICSTFEQGSFGEFRLHLLAADTCTLKRRPASAEGRYKSAIDSITFADGINCISIPICTYRINRLHVHSEMQGRDQIQTLGSPSLLTLTVEMGRGHEKIVLASSCAYGDNCELSSMVFVDDVNIEPWMCKEHLLAIVVKRSVNGHGSSTEIASLAIQSDDVLEVLTPEYHMP